MVEIMILAVAIIGIRAAYLWLVRGKGDAKSFVDRSASAVLKTAGWIALIATIGFIALIALFAS